jgi:hypothetical protein
MSIRDVFVEKLYEQDTTYKSFTDWNERIINEICNDLNDLINDTLWSKYIDFGSYIRFEPRYLKDNSLVKKVCIINKETKDMISSLNSDFFEELFTGGNDNERESEILDLIYTDHSYEYIGNFTQIYDDIFNSEHMLKALILEIYGKNMDIKDCCLDKIYKKIIEIDPNNPIKEDRDFLSTLKLYNGLNLLNGEDEDIFSMLGIKILAEPNRKHLKIRELRNEGVASVNTIHESIDKALDQFFKYFSKKEGSLTKQHLEFIESRGQFTLDMNLSTIIYMTNLPNVDLKTYDIKDTFKFIISRSLSLIYNYRFVRNTHKVNYYMHGQIKDELLLPYARSISLHIFKSFMILDGNFYKDFNVYFIDIGPILIETKGDIESNIYFKQFKKDHLLFIEEPNKICLGATKKPFKLIFQ